jgi:hypothetical protein
MSAHTAIDTFLARLLDRWRSRQELAGIGEIELSRLASEFNVTSSELIQLVEEGPEASGLLYKRLHALGLSRADVEHAADGLIFSLERTCAHCREKGVCERDLAKQPENPVWEIYCPNSTDLNEVISQVKDRLPA